ncbi:metallophosphoesterase family protein [Undibacterium flavidum]|uniref:Metallophosphoesterase family protein n=1 Tax=Undibacterium flavidum TaxID=2762297 RepID=A0ABR6YHA1_9BURK|nr:metallophosphoesterase family protein [Undibacterium flavidum]MBC3875964.1 metallophosphoesterase family protein [Undibacterium flavidum]
MLLAVLTDLHANREALEACLAHAQERSAEQYAFLGDLVGYGADPGWVIDTVSDYVQRGAYVLMGNHDLGVLQDERKDMNPNARYVVEWTRQNLNPQQLEFIQALPMQFEIDQCLFVHANAWAPERWEYVDGNMEAARSMRATNAQITFCGHVHTPSLYNMNHAGKVGTFTPVSELSVPLSKLRRWLVQPGSVGQPRDGNPAACYALFDTQQLELTFFRVPYDNETASQKVLAAGLPASLARRLIQGG